MKQLLITTMAAMVLAGCGESQQSAPAPEAKPAEPVPKAATPEPPTAKAPDISIHQAVKDGNIEAVKQRLAAGTDVNAKDVDLTPLHFAAVHGRKEVAALLIAEGADVNTKDRWGKTPLHFAASKGQKEVATQLITEGADVNAKTTSQDGSGATPIEWAIEEGHTETVDLLRKHGAKTGEELKAEGKSTNPVAESAQPEPPTDKTPDDSLWEAAMFGEIEAAKKAIADGANVNAKKDDGETPLHWATVESMDSGSKKVIELLISKGADVNAKIVTGRKKGMTPLAIAKMFSNKEIADLLRKHGAKTGEELKAEGK
jgi:ankyrin repeat protein